MLCSAEVWNYQPPRVVFIRTWQKHCEVSTLYVHEFRENSQKPNDWTAIDAVMKNAQETNGGLDTFKHH